MSLRIGRCAFVVFLDVLILRVPATPSNVTSSAATSGNCRNPLFATHWAGKSDVRHLEATPTLESGLSICPFYNGQIACCPAGFEDVLKTAFQRWVDHLRREAKQIEAFKVQLVSVRVSEAYVTASELEQALLDKALESAAPVLALYGDCFDTMLEYIAGVLCFSCAPDWQTKVFMDTANIRVTHLRIADTSNEALWQSCAKLGDAAARFQARASDSALAKSIESRFVDLSMFANKIGVTESMATQALLVMRGPSEVLLEVVAEEQSLPAAATQADAQPAPTTSPTMPPAPPDAASSDSASSQRRLSAANPPLWTSSIVAAGQLGGTLLDPVRDGRLSGLECSAFPRTPMTLLDSGSGAIRCKTRLAAMLVFAAAAVVF